MSYPPPQHYTPPYGQPPLPPQRNLWLIGSFVIAVLIILMTVTLLIVMQANDQDRAEGGGSGSGGGETTQETTSEAAESEDVPPPTEETTTSGDRGGSSTDTVFSEETCASYDVSEFEELFGEAVDPDASYAFAWEGSAGDTGSVTCSFYIGWNSASIAVTVNGDAASAKRWYDSDREFWDDDDKYDVADYKDFGDDGYYYTFGSTEYKKVLISGVVGSISFTADTWVDLGDIDVDDVLAMLQRLIDQAYELFGEYETN